MTPTEIALNTFMAIFINFDPQDDVVISDIPFDMAHDNGKF
jgi:hypothetical protein